MCSRGKASKTYGYIAFWMAQNIALVALNGHLSIFRWINFYTFENLDVWVWDPKPVYKLQNSSGYGTGVPIAFDHYHFGSGCDAVLVMIAEVYNCVTCYCVTVSTSHSSVGNNRSPPWVLRSMSRLWHNYMPGCEIMIKQ